MIKSFFKILLFVFLITIFLIVGCLLAAPYLVRQDQIRAYVEKDFKLPDGKQLKLPEHIDFGVFPYVYLKTKEVIIKSPTEADLSLKNISLGFSFNDLLSNSVKFDIGVNFKDNDYQGEVKIVEYQKFYKEGTSPVEINLSKPIPAELNGVLTIKNGVTKFNEFKLTHKDTNISGDIELANAGGKKNKINGNVTFDTKNIDDVRRLIQFDKYKDELSLLEGVGLVKLKFDTIGSDDYEFRRNLNAIGSVKLDDVILYGFDLEEIISNPAIVSFTNDKLRKIDLNGLSTAFKVQKGIARISDILANSDKLNVTGNGTLDIAEEIVNLSTLLDINLPKAQMKLPVDIIGDVRNPKIKARIDKLLKGKITDALGQAQDSILSNPAELLNKNNEESLKNLGKSLKDSLIGGFGN